MARAKRGRKAVKAIETESGKGVIQERKERITVKRVKHEPEGEDLEISDSYTFFPGEAPQKRLQRRERREQEEREEGERLSESLSSEESFHNEYDDFVLGELETLQKEIDDETPNEGTIIRANLTRNDKKLCLRYLEQARSAEDHSEDYYKAIDKINSILAKSSKYTKAQIEFLEKEEARLNEWNGDDSDELKTKILLLNAQTEVKAKLLTMYDRMKTYPEDSTLYNSLKEELEWSVRLPYNSSHLEAYDTLKGEQLNKFYEEVMRTLDRKLFGMKEVKERILHILNDRTGRNIALVGPPGVGKTAICKALADIFGKKFAKISGATLDSAAIKGSNKVYVSSEPSIILQILSSLGTNNAIIMIDEVDKMDTRAQHALLHVADASDNSQFQDGYLKHFSHDLSNVKFVYNMNSLEGMDRALVDRLEVIEVSEYSMSEKATIFSKYMLPKVLSELGFKKDDVTVTEEVVMRFLHNTNGRSLRDLEKACKNIVGKFNMYKKASLKDGTMGDCKFSYTIPKFKLPYKLTYELMLSLSL